MKVHNFTLCDIARTEDNGKAILIGVYTNGIVFSQLPATANLTLWMLLEPEEDQSTVLNIRCIWDDTGKEVIKVKADVEFPENNSRWGAISMMVPFKFDHTGSVTIEMALDDGPWSPLRTLTIEVGDIPGIHPIVIEPPPGSKQLP